MYEVKLGRMTWTQSSKPLQSSYIITFSCFSSPSLLEIILHLSLQQFFLLSRSQWQEQKQHLLSNLHWSLGKPWLTVTHSEDDLSHHSCYSATWFTNNNWKFLTFYHIFLFDFSSQYLTHLFLSVYHTHFLWPRIDLVKNGDYGSAKYLTLFASSALSWVAFSSGGNAKPGRYCCSWCKYLKAINFTGFTKWRY